MCLTHESQKQDRIKLRLVEGGSEIDELIKTAKPTGAALQEAVFFKSAVLFGSGDKDGAKALLLEAQKLAPNTATGKRIPKIIEANFK